MKDNSKKLIFPKFSNKKIFSIKTIEKKVFYLSCLGMQSPIQRLTKDLLNNNEMPKKQQKTEKWKCVSLISLKTFLVETSVAFQEQNL